MIYKCRVCGRTDRSLNFYWHNDKMWCNVHVPREIKQDIDSWAYDK